MATNVYRGSDGTISVAVEASPEGELAAAVDAVTGAYGRRFTMQDLERANLPTTSGLRAQPSLRF